VVIVGGVDLEGTLPTILKIWFAEPMQVFCKVGSRGSAAGHDIYAQPKV